MEELEALSTNPTLWNNLEKAQKLMQEKNLLESFINDIKNIERRLKDNQDLIELGELENDNSIVLDAEKDLLLLKEEIKNKELETLLSGEADKNNCFLEINAGSGGTEACDWAEMLHRMYYRWSEKKGYKVDLIEETAGDVAGIKSVTIKISGYNAYGWLKLESGVHRLVRISPFDSNSRRHTSFASVWVYPEVDDKIEISINEKDCRIDTYRASGAGGQHINKTDSAVRITHNPTGIVVQCQNERSQIQNKEQAWSMLKARLYELELQKKREISQSIEDQKTDIGWGHQIRSYVLQPYQMVKDLRTEAETSDTKGVLDGEIDVFLTANLSLIKGK